jgi:hypothetical protein
MKSKKKEEKQYYTYESETRGRVEVFCTRPDFLFLKLTYDAGGLSPKEYDEYKSYFK